MVLTASPPPTYYQVVMELPPPPVYVPVADVKLSASDTDLGLPPVFVADDSKDGPAAPKRMCLAVLWCAVQASL
jgi:hypothetical protein